MKLYFVFLILFFGISLLLVIGHWGVAIRITNWIFYLLTAFVVWALIKYEK